MSLKNNGFITHGDVAEPCVPKRLLTGLVAGSLSKPLKKSRVLPVLFGVISGVMFSFIMDVWTVSWYTGNIDTAAYLAVLITVLPHTVLYAVSNVIFLLFFAKPFGEKSVRLIIKYGVQRIKPE